MTSSDDRAESSEKGAGRARVLIADDHPFVLDSLVTLLKEHFDVIGTASDGEALVDAATRLRPDVVITDISMPGLNGIDALRRLRAAGSEAKVIFLTLHADAEVAATLTRTGASGYVLKLAATNELVAAIERVVGGGTYITPGLDRDASAPTQSNT
jgi:DNA-binding NarL/FixJ family response regulator